MFAPPGELGHLGREPPAAGLWMGALSGRAGRQPIRFTLEAGHLNRGALPQTPTPDPDLLPRSSRQESQSSGEKAGCSDSEGEDSKHGFSVAQGSNKGDSSNYFNHGFHSNQISKI